LASEGRRVVLITGARGALGSILVTYFLERSWSVIGVDKSETTARPDDRRRDVVADLEVEPAIATMVAEAQAAFGSIDLAVNAIGWIHSEPTLRLEGGRLLPHARRTWDQAIVANLTIPCLVAAAVAAVMARQRSKGVIVNISSVSARGNGGQVAYAAAKAGLEAATVAMARDLGPLGIRVNGVPPGFLDTSTTHAALTAERIEEVKTHTPLRRLGSPSDVAAAIEFCWSNPFMNGAVVPVDGGIIL